MRLCILRLVTFSACLAVASPLWALERKLVEIVEKRCKTELESFCSQVTPGEGRILSCLYAHNDKLSGQCEFALYDTAVQLERAVAALTYVASECDDDIDQHCGSVMAGEGRVLACLKENSSQISQRCGQAMTDVGIE